MSPGASFLNGIKSPCWTTHFYYGDKGNINVLAASESRRFTSKPLPGTRNKAYFTLSKAKYFLEQTGMIKLSFFGAPKLTLVSNVCQSVSLFALAEG